jgi:hypothetical protein
MMKNLVKWGSLLVSFLGFLMVIYGWTDRLLLSFGQTLMQVGSVFFIGGFIAYQINNLAGRISFATNILRDIDASLSIPQHSTPEVDMGLLPKTTAQPFNFDFGSNVVTTNTSTSLGSISLPKAVPVMEEPKKVIEPQKAEMIEELIRQPAPEQPKMADPQRHNYYQDLANHLEPQLEVAQKPAHSPPPPPSPFDKMRELKPIFPVQPAVVQPVVKVKELKVEEPPENLDHSADWMARNQQRLAELAQGFPELGAILKKEEKTEDILVDQPIEEEPIEPQAAVIREGQVSGIPFKLYSDGTIEAQFSNGGHRFASIAEFKTYVEGA